MCVCQFFYHGNVLHSYVLKAFCVTVTVTVTLQFQMYQKLSLNTMEHSWCCRLDVIRWSLDSTVLYTECLRYRA